MSLALKIQTINPIIPSENLSDRTFTIRREISEVAAQLDMAQPTQAAALEALFRASDRLREVEAALVKYNREILSAWAAIPDLAAAPESD